MTTRRDFKLSKRNSREISTSFAPLRSRGRKKQFRKNASDLAAIAMDACAPRDSPNPLWLVREMRNTFKGPMIAISGSPLYREQLMMVGCDFQSPKGDLPAKIIEVLEL
jgi:hypothetical protein